MQWPPEFTRMVGRWKGSVRMTDAHGTPQESWQLSVDCAIEGNRLLIENARTAPDGTTTIGKVEGTLAENGQVILKSPAIAGRAWGSEGVVLAEWHLSADPGATFWELSIIHDGQYRTRTWHHLQDGKLTAISIVEERRIA